MTAVVQTVTGPIAPEQLGVTMPHEHLLLLNPSFVEPLEASERHRAYEPVSERNIEWVRQYWTSNVDNLQLYDEETAREEAAWYYRAGGDTLIDPTTRYIARDPRALVRISRGSGVRIVSGTGFYVAETHPPDMGGRSEEDLAAEMIGELTEGIDYTGVRAGFIGEIGCFWPLRDDEQKVLRGAAMASIETGAAVMVHPGRHPDAPPGHAERLLVSMDICTKHRLHRYGGHGYDHILENILPWMRRRGTSEEILQTLLVENPRRVFPMNAP